VNERKEFAVSKDGFSGKQCDKCDDMATIIYCHRAEHGEMTFKFRCWGHGIGHQKKEAS
jgi:hypothetical protein